MLKLSIPWNRENNFAIPREKYILKMKILLLIWKSWLTPDKNLNGTYLDMMLDFHLKLNQMMTEDILSLLDTPPTQDSILLRLNEGIKD